MTKPFIDNEKYRTTGETKNHFGITLHRIKAKIAIGVIAAGTIGGWVEKESNISVYGDAWVYGNARVYGDAWVSGAYRHIIISPIGSEGGCLTAFVEKDGTIRLSRGCFNGTIDEFSAAVEETHGASKNGDEYRLAVELIKSRLDTTVIEDEALEDAQ